MAPNILRTISTAALAGALLVAPEVAGTNAVSNAVTPTAGTNLTADGTLAGRVLGMVEHAGRLYLAGEFTGLRSPSADSGVLDAQTGAAQRGYPRLGDGVIKAAVADGSGGWYVAGTFDMIEGEARPGLANITSDGRVGDWHPEVTPTGGVKALARSAATGTIYLGGDFTAAGSLARPGLAAVNGVTGEVMSAFDPETGGIVRTLATSFDGGRLYAGGRLGEGDSSARRGLAAVDTVTGARVDWDPDIVGRVDALALAPDGGVFAAGDFSRVAGQDHANLVRLDPATGAPGAWSGTTDGPAAALALSPDGARLYAGGEFTSARGAQSTELRSGLAAFDAASGEPLAGWDPAPDGNVAALAASPDGRRLYVGGGFARLAGAERPGLGAVDTTSGTNVPSWQPDAGGTVEVLAPSGELLLAGGRLDRVIERSVPYLAALDVDSGAVEPGFAPRPDGPARALALAPGGDRLYAAGEFTQAGGLRQSGVAALDPVTGAADPGFNPPAPNGAVQAIAISPDGGRLYIGGEFDSLTTTSGAVPRPAHLAALDATTGALLPWDPPRDRGGAYTGQTGRPTPEAVAEVNALVASADGSRVYAGGTFLDIGGRSGLVTLEAGTGQAASWQPDMDRPVNGLAESPDGAFLYAATGGYGGQIQAFAPAGKQAPAWERTTDGDAMSVAVSATRAYLAGHFDYVCERCGRAGGAGDDFRRHMAAFDARTGELDPWAPVANTKTGPYSAAVGAAHVYIGGEFTRINDLPQPGVAQFAGPP